MLKLIAGVFLVAFSTCAQDWTPSRIVAITEYPDLASRLRITGEVEIKCTLDSGGSVTKAEIVSGNQWLRDAARENALLWKFKFQGDAPQSNSVTLTYIFTIGDQAKRDNHTDFLVDLPNTIRIITPQKFIQ
jgi:TonB family protein